MIRKLSLIFMIISLLLCFGAFAEETVYLPGETASQLFQNAFNEGKMVMADIRLNLQADAGAMGLSGEDAEALQAASQALSNAVLTLGAGKINKGLRLELSAQYAADTPIAADAALNITYDGLLLETSLLEGEAVSARWETLLALCGLDNDEIQQLLSLRDQDLLLLASQAIEAVGPYLQMAGQMFAPYAETVSAHLAALPSETKTNLPDDGYYPAVAQEFSVMVTAADLGRLLTALADQLENDSMLSMLLSSVLAQQSELPVSNTAELCNAVRLAGSALEKLTHPVTLYIGTNASGAPLYLSINSTIDDSTVFAFDAVHRPATEEQVNQFMLDICTLNIAEEMPTIIDGLTSAFDYAVDPANSNVYGTSGQLLLVESCTPFLSAEFAFSNEAILTEDGQNGYAGQQALTLSVSEEIADAAITVVLTSDSLSACTADGGERSMISGSVDTYVDDTTTPVTFANEFFVSPTADGPVAAYTETSSMPTNGISEFKEVFSLYTKPYDSAASAALNLIQLETISSDDMQALVNRLSHSAQALAGSLQSALPPQAIELLADML
ncbi:MAG: hypothetical protein IJ381_02145 [Clostridia bacterium]|nr:hypothetical protein [Clostridia bacterium]